MCGESVTDAQPHQRIEAWRRAVPLVRTSDPALSQAILRSLEDLGSLRLFDPDEPSRVAVAAGAPWFMTVFGRDSLLTAYMALLVDPELALGVLQTLARFQGTKVDSETEEQPGRILHEMRFGSATSAGLVRCRRLLRHRGRHAVVRRAAGRAASLGAQGRGTSTSCCRTPTARWTGSSSTGTADGDGFVEYERMTSAAACTTRAGRTRGTGSRSPTVRQPAGADRPG